jgi:hypothetical protein
MQSLRPRILQRIKRHPGPCTPCGAATVCQHDAALPVMRLASPRTFCGHCPWHGLPSCRVRGLGSQGVGVPCGTKRDMQLPQLAVLQTPQHHTCLLPAAQGDCRARCCSWVSKQRHLNTQNGSPSTGWPAGLRVKMPAWHLDPEPSGAGPQLIHAACGAQLVVVVSDQ